MKTVYLVDKIVKEIIPDYALPVETWYGAEFAAQCVEAQEEVEQGWVYDPVTNNFFIPPAHEPAPELPEPIIDPITSLELAVAELAEQQAADQTANELALAELAEIVLGG